MAFTVIANSTTADAVEVLNNFYHIGQGNRLPMGGTSLASTSGVYDLGSAAYKWRDGYFSGSLSVADVNITGDLVVVGSLGSIKATDINVTNISATSIYCNSLTAFDSVAAGEYRSRNYVAGSPYLQIGATNMTLIIANTTGAILALRPQTGKLIIYDLPLTDTGSVLDHNGLGNKEVGTKLDASVFTGYHYYQKDNDISMGMAVILENGIAMKSSQPKQTNIIGIASGHKMPGGRYVSDKEDEVATTEKHIEIAALGDSRDWNRTHTHFLTGFNVCNENGKIKEGDLLVTSSKPGFCMKQDDDIIRAYTIGKCLDRIEFDKNGEARGIYGILYAG